MVKKLYDIAPFLMVLITGLTALCSSMGWYHSIFQYLPDTIGYSITTNLIMLRVYRSPKFCNATRICVYGLIVMNILSLVLKPFDEYNSIYDMYIFIILLILLVVLKFTNKW